ncbi:MAG: hypothetical protein IPG70_08555 [Moraxellaceae bacterium]|nr:hypothetical protein [Moraxellaceae bacterium]
MQALFNDDDLSVMLSEGMHANPKVGSTIFGEKLATCLDVALKLTIHHPHVKKQFEDLFAEHVTGQQAQPLRVVIVGSVFGGTGSGIVPTLARNLSSVLGNGPTVATVTTLPWFTLRVGADGQTGSASDERKLKRNTSFAIRNFNAQLAASTVASVFIQSGPDWPLIERPSAGDFDQPEHPHLINLIAASAVQRLFETDVFQPNHLYAPFALTP